MNVVETFKRAVTMILDHPILLAFGLLVSGVRVALSFVPILGNGILLFLGPFLVAGFLGMVNVAFTDSPRMDSFTAAGRQNYLRMFGGQLAFGIVITVVMVAVTVPSIILLYFFVPSVTGGPLVWLEPSVIALVVATGVLASIPVLAVITVLQFFDVAIIVDDTDIVDAFKQSYTLFRKHTRSVVGYSLARAGLFVLVSGPAILLLSGFVEGGTLATSPAEIAAVPSLASIIGGVLFAGLANAVLLTYHVSYYRSLSSN